MKKSIGILFLLLIFNTICFAQVNNDLIIEQIERMSENSEEDSDYSELIESYWDLVENPIYINSDEIDRLAEFKFISAFQLENIKKYRKEYGDFKFIEELYEVKDLDKKTIEILEDLICFNDNSNKALRLKDLKYGKNKILIEVNQCLNKKKGYINIEDSLLYQKPNSIYLGSPQKIYLRYNYSYRDRIEAGFVLEKDPGEYIIKSLINDSIRELLGKQCYSGFDYLSFHLLLSDLGFCKALVIGDYKISFGQGLTIGSGIALSTYGGNMMRRNKKISASKSANEAYYLRGSATTLKYNNFELSAFYSYKKTDANTKIYDSISETPLKITSLQQSGLHRTYNELMDRRIISQRQYGFNISYKISNLQVGYTMHKTDLSAELMPDENIYNTFYFRGKKLTNQGLDFYYILKKTMIYGEFALSSNKGSAALIGTTIQPAGYIEFTILYRNYAKDYQCLYSNAYASGSKNRNEKGWLLNSTISIAANWKYLMSIDLYKSDWLKNNAYSPNHGHDFDMQLNYQPNKNTLFFIEFRNKNKMKNTGDNNVFQKYLVEERNNMIRFHAAYQISNYITLKNRLEYHFNKDDDISYNSYLLYQDIIFAPIDKEYNLAFRYELFNAEEGSVYAYESDVLYAFSVGGLSGKGIRTYIVGKLKILRQIQISSKIGFTFHENKNEIGSGLETIYNNWKGDAKLQVIWSF